MVQVSKGTRRSQGDSVKHHLRQLSHQAQAPVNIVIVPTLMQARRLGVTQEDSGCQLQQSGASREYSRVCEAEVGNADAESPSTPIASERLRMFSWRGQDVVPKTTI